VIPHRIFSSMIEMDSSQEHVAVAVRVRPLNVREVSSLDPFLTLRLTKGIGIAGDVTLIWRVFTSWMQMTLPFRTQSIPTVSHLCWHALLNRLRVWSRCFHRRCVQRRWETHRGLIC